MVDLSVFLTLLAYGCAAMAVAVVQRDETLTGKLLGPTIWRFVLFGLGLVHFIQAAFFIQRTP